MPPKASLITTALLALNGVATQVQEIPDAGSLYNQQQPRIKRIERLPEKEDKEEELVVPETDSVKVKVKSIRIEGGEGLEDPEALQELVKDAIGRDLGFTQLQQLADRITRHLRANGWLLARAYLPKQDVTEGNILIVIVQGKIDADGEGHGIVIQRQPGTRLSEDKIRSRMRIVIGDGQGVHLRDLERGLLLLNDLPGVYARSTLEKGSRPGTTRLRVDASEDPLLSGSFGIDDFGNRYAGAWRGNLGGSVNDPFGWGDQLSIGGSGAEGLGQGSANYSVPIGSSGLVGTAYYSYLHYHIGRELAYTDSFGSGQYTGGGLSYPFIRRRDYSLWAQIDYAHKDLRDNTLGQLTSHRQIDNGNIGLRAQNRDDWLEGGLTQASFTTTIGSVDRSDVPEDLASDQATAKTNGRYNKFAFSLARLQKLGERFSFYAAAAGQLADRNLASAEKFILGGPNGIRAYPVGEASGDSGWLANFELRYEVPFDTSWGDLQVVGFFDTGHITLHERRWKNDLNNLCNCNEYSLSGSGIGLNLARDQLYALRLTWAHVIGDNPGRSPNNLDSDGQADTDRFWLQTVVNF